MKLLTTILTYPSSAAAELHMHANQLGKRDLRKVKEEGEEKPEEEMA